MFRILAGLLSLLFVPFGVFFLLFGGMKQRWALAAVFWGLVFGVYAIAGKSRRAFGSEQPKDGAPEQTENTPAYRPENDRGNKRS